MAGYVEDRSVEFIELFLRNVFHARSNAGGRRGKQAAAPVDHKLDARILGNRKRLNAAAGVAHYRDLRGVELVVVLAVFATVLGDGPVDGVDQLRRLCGLTSSARIAAAASRGGRARIRRGLRLLRRPDSHNQKSVRGNFAQKVFVESAVVGTAAFPPCDDRE